MLRRGKLFRVKERTSQLGRKSDQLVRVFEEDHHQLTELGTFEDCIECLS